MGEYGTASGGQPPDSLRLISLDEAVVDTLFADWATGDQLEVAGESVANAAQVAASLSQCTMDVPFSELFLRRNPDGSMVWACGHKPQPHITVAN